MSQLDPFKYKSLGTTHLLDKLSVLAFNYVKSGELLAASRVSIERSEERFERFGLLERRAKKDWSVSGYLRTTRPIEGNSWWQTMRAARGERSGLGWAMMVGRPLRTVQNSTVCNFWFDSSHIHCRWKTGASKKMGDRSQWGWKEKRMGVMWKRVPERQAYGKNDR